MIHKMLTVGATVLGTWTASALGASATKADEVFYLSDDASYCEIFRGLSRIIPGECARSDSLPADQALRGKYLTRSIVRRSDKNSQQTEEPDVYYAEPSDERAIALRVQFDFNSATLSEESIDVLNRVVAVLNSDLMSGNTIRIEGHADAVGSATYNQLLSERRAAAVTDFLMTRHVINPRRIEHVGKGETEPLLPADRTNGINRRVQFVNQNG